MSRESPARAPWYNRPLTIMPFPVVEQPASIVRHGMTPIVAAHPGFQQDRSVILQLGSADAIQLVSIALTERIIYDLCSP